MKFDEPIDEIKVILRQFIGLLDQDRRPIPFLERKGAVELTPAQLVGRIKHLLSFDAQPVDDLGDPLRSVEVVLWRCNHLTIRFLRLFRTLSLLGSFDSSGA